MATIHSVNLSSVDKNTIKVNIVKSMGVDEDFLYYRITTNSDSIDTQENTIDINYKRSGDSTVNISVILYYHIWPSYWTRDSSSTSIYDIAKHTSKQGDYYIYKTFSDQLRLVYVFDTYDEGYYIYQPYYERRNPITKNVSKTEIFYQYPSTDFSFNNCISGNSWKCSSGISSLIDNITEFQDYATQWKKWKEQSGLVSQCPSFFQNNILTAAALNSVHTYIGTGKSYNAGAIMTADMLNSLTTFMNQ